MLNELRTTAHPWVVERRDRITFALEWATELDTSLQKRGQMIEELGFDALYVGDHPAWDRECWLQLAQLAQATTRLRLGPLVACPSYRLPVVSARLATDLDHLSEGRLVLGLGIGWDASLYGLGRNEFERLGLSFPSQRARQDALAETITIIRGCWAEKPFSFAGGHYQAQDVHITPPIQSQGVPLIIAGGGNRTLDQVARLADACNFGGGPTGGVYSAQEVGERLQYLWMRCTNAGRPVTHVLPSHFTTWLVLAPDDASLAAKLERFFPDGLDDVWERLVIARTPAGATAYYQDLADVGMRHFVVQILEPDDLETVQLLAGEVMPSILGQA